MAHEQSDDILRQNLAAMKESAPAAAPINPTEFVADYAAEIGSTITAHQIKILARTIPVGTPGGSALRARLGELIRAFDGGGGGGHAARPAQQAAAPIATAAPTDSGAAVAARGLPERPSNPFQFSPEEMQRLAAQPDGGEEFVAAWKEHTRGAVFQDPYAALRRDHGGTSAIGAAATNRELVKVLKQLGGGGNKR